MKNSLSFPFKFSLYYFLILMVPVLVFLVYAWISDARLFGNLWLDLLFLVLLPLFILGFLPLFIAIFLAQKIILKFERPKLIFVYLPLVTIVFSVLFGYLCYKIIFFIF